MQAFALGSEADTSYLAAVASDTHGGYSSVSDDSALNDMFTRLGDRLAAPVQVAVDVPPLTRGTHTLEIRARVDGQPAVATRDVPVTNDGLLTGSLQSPSGAGSQDLEVLNIASMAPDGSLALQAEAGGVTLPVLGQPPRVLVDPWRFQAGPVQVNVTASLNDTVVSTASFTVEVPPLAPRIGIDLPSGPGGGAARNVVVHGQVQGAAPGAMLVVTVDGREVARGPLPDLRVPAPRGSQVVASVVDAAGSELATTSASLPAAPAAQSAASTGPAPWASLVAAAMGALAVGLYASRRWSGRPRRERRGPLEWEPNARTLLVGRGHPEAAADPGPLATLVVRSPQGVERRYAVGRRPLSLGRSAQCDVIIDAEAVSELHARLVAIGGGEFRVHAIAPRPGLACDERRPDEWLVVHLDEPIAIGGHTLTLYEAEASVA